jgi:3-oxoadipate enol-lactonase
MINVGGAQIPVRDSVKDHARPPVVLLHGLSMTSDSCWQGTYEPLAARHRVVAFDLRGHGSGSPVKGYFSLETCADDVLAVVETLGLDRFIAVGYSIGGLIAQTLWHRDRHALKGMVLCATAHYPLTPVEWALSAAPRMGMSWRRGMTARPVGLPAAATEYLLRSISDPAVRADVARRSHIEPWVFGSALQAAAKFDARPWIDSVDVPTAVVITTRDAIMIPWRQRALANAIPDATSHELRAGHLAPVRHPHRLARAIVSACESVVGTRASATV